ncbi:hypothetical protein BGO18_03150 [Candidatus Saccharibacteria bacterium 47-87]|jgi:FKBP-type peptidyl-prolyl cis-trans isomerase|nr:MAG: hypothetical protein BGO18_03150 [Candidatus Saccharibacteria bacterium 47-87]
MATTKVQRIGIWVIAAFMAVGTIGSFAIIVLANNNTQKDQARFNELYSKYQTEQSAYQAKVDAQTKELSDKYFSTFSPYLSNVASFDASSVKELGKQDLVEGTGDAITSESSFSAYYIGWNPSGKMFDSSFSDAKDSLKAPLPVTPGGVIKGWTQGVDGMKVGGIRELTIPADLAYGKTGSGADIPADTPLKFVVMIIPAPEAIAQPAMSSELITLYTRLYGK